MFNFTYFTLLGFIILSFMVKFLFLLSKKNFSTQKSKWNTNFRYILRYILFAILSQKAIKYIFNMGTERGGNELELVAETATGGIL